MNSKFLNEAKELEKRWKESGLLEGMVDDNRFSRQQTAVLMEGQRLMNEIFKGTISVDFDGVVHRYSKGWQDGKIYDEPFPGVREALQSFLDQGYEIVIFTTRADDRVTNGKEEKGQYDEVVAYLQEHDIPYTRVHKGVGKPLCKLFIDDNALRFEGDWKQTVEQALKILNGEI